MLYTIDGKRINKVAHSETFQHIIERLGLDRAEAVRRYLNEIISELPPDSNTGYRSFSSSYLGSRLTPWPDPLAYLYEVAREVEGSNANEDEVQDRAALIFGQFIWECIMNRNENWVFYDPNLDPRKPRTEITGKVYFERGS